MAEIFFTPTILRYVWHRQESWVSFLLVIFAFARAKNRNICDLHNVASVIPTALHVRSKVTLLVHVAAKFLFGFRCACADCTPEAALTAQVMEGIPDL